MQVLLGIMHSGSWINVCTLAVQIQPDQIFSAQQKDCQACQQAEKANPLLHSNGVAESVQVVLPIILCAINTGTGQSAENG